MSDLYFEVKALLGDECQCGGDFLKCSTKEPDPNGENGEWTFGCCSYEAIGDMTGYCGGDTMRKLWEFWMSYNSIKEHFRIGMQSDYK